jgi:hypothetical protein
MKLFVIKVVKCKQSSILTSIQNTKSLYSGNCQKATGAKDGSGNWPMSNICSNFMRTTKLIKKALKK